MRKDMGELEKVAGNTAELQVQVGELTKTLQDNESDLKIVSEKYKEEILKRKRLHN
jgi:hypothetical protein